MFDYLKGNVGTGLLIGVGALILAPVVLPLVGSVLKATTKAAVKTGVTLYEIGSETVGKVGEIVGDFVTETAAGLTGEQEEEAKTS
jgi:galactitol-specific phosphotransferase system IIC component